MGMNRMLSFFLVHGSLQEYPADRRGQTRMSAPSSGARRTQPATCRHHFREWTRDWMTNGHLIGSAPQPSRTATVWVAGEI